MKRVMTRERHNQMNPGDPKSALHEAIFKCLGNITIFSELNAEELNLMAARMHFSRSVKGSVIFKEGDPGDFVCFVVDGILEVVKTSADGAEKIIAKLIAGCSIGEMAVVGSFPRSATVRSRSEATLLTLQRDRLNEICRDYPHIGVKIYRAIAQLLSMHLRRTSENLSELMPPDEKSS
jgi:CRP/FNR family cyclic AMP-dependent transcriptional regulator